MKEFATKSAVFIQAPDHWFFTDLDGGTTPYSSEFIKNIREEVGNRCKNENLFAVFIFMKFSDGPIVSTMAIRRNDWFNEAFGIS